MFKGRIPTCNLTLTLFLIETHKGSTIMDSILEPGPLCYYPILKPNLYTLSPKPLNPLLDGCHAAMSVFSVCLEKALLGLT